MILERVEVSWRDHDWRPLPAVRVDSVVMHDGQFDRHAGPRRWFWLPDEGVQLVYEPFGWSKEWYVDLVRIESRQVDGVTRYRVTDQYLDLIVEGSGPTYRMVDLDELADAITTSALSIDRGLEVLRNAQRFVDRYLHRSGIFPPPQIRRFFSPDHRHPLLP